jgi:hypothetical protein
MFVEKYYALTLGNAIMTKGEFVYIVCVVYVIVMALLFLISF